MFGINKTHKLLLGIAAVIFCINCITLLYTYSSIPNTIVIHSYKGEADSYGHKSYLWIIAAFNAFLLLVIASALLYIQRMQIKSVDSKAENLSTGGLVLAIVAVKISIIFSIVLFKR